MSNRSKFLIFLLSALLFFTAIQKNIFAYINEISSPEVAGTTTSVGGFVEPTPENQAWEQLTKKEQELNKREAEINQKISEYSFFFNPTEKYLSYLYAIIVFLFALVITNLFLDYKLWKRLKKSTT